MDKTQPEDSVDNAMEATDSFQSQSADLSEEPEWYSVGYHTREINLLFQNYSLSNSYEWQKLVNVGHQDWTSLSCILMNSKQIYNVAKCGDLDYSWDCLAWVNDFTVEVVSIWDPVYRVTFSLVTPSQDIVAPQLLRWGIDSCWEPGHLSLSSPSAGAAVTMGIDNLNSQPETLVSPKGQRQTLSPGTQHPSLKMDTGWQSTHTSMPQNSLGNKNISQR